MTSTARALREQNSFLLLQSAQIRRGKVEDAVHAVCMQVLCGSLQEPWAVAQFSPHLSEGWMLQENKQLWRAERPAEGRARAHPNRTPRCLHRGHTAGAVTRKPSCFIRHQRIQWYQCLTAASTHRTMCLTSAFLQCLQAKFRTSLQEAVHKPRAHLFPKSSLLVAMQPRAIPLSLGTSPLLPAKASTSSPGALKDHNCPVHQ